MRARAALCVVLLVGATARADEWRDHARVVGATRTTLYLDAGSDLGLEPGMRWVTTGTTASTLRVLAVSKRSAVVAVEAGDRPAIGSQITLPPGRRAQPPSPGPRAAPAPASPWMSRFVSSARPRVPVPGGSLTNAAEDERAPGPPISGEIAAHALVADATGAQSPGTREVGVSSQLTARFGEGWTWDHLLDARTVATPVQPFTAATPTTRLDVYLLRLAWAPPRGRFGFDVGRIVAAPGTAAGLVDGGRVRLFAARGLEVGAHSGLRPETDRLAPDIAAPTAGISAHARSTSRVGPSRQADVALVADGWRGGIDRAYATGRASTDLTPALGLDADVIADFADDASGRGGARFSRASLGTRARLFDGTLGLRASGGMDRPVWTRALAARIADVSPYLARRWFGLGDLDVRITDVLFLEIGGQGDRGDDDLWFASGDARVRWLDLGVAGAYGWVGGHAFTGTLLEGAGPEIGWNAPLGEIAHIDLSYAFDAYRFETARTALQHRGRVALDRDLGRRFRSALSVEGTVGEDPATYFVFLTVAARLGP